MKRSGFPRAVYERRPRVLPVPVPGLFRLGEVSEARSPLPKDAPLRSESYRRWVASLPCAICSVVGRSQAAHENAGKGMALKACDSRLFPACGPQGLNIGCHARVDLSVDMTKDERRTLELRLVLKTQAKAIDAGWDMDTLKRIER